MFCLFVLPYYVVNKDEYFVTIVFKNNQAERRYRTAHLLARWKHERTTARCHAHKEALSLQPASITNSGAF